MRHLMERTRNLDPRFRDIARYYKQHGEALRHPLGLRLLPDAARDQLPVLQDRQRPAGATWIPRRTISPASAPPAAACPATASPTSRPACWRRCSISSPTPASAWPSRWRRAPREAGRHHRAVAGAAAAGALRRPHQPLGQGPQLRQVDRVGRRALSPGQLHGRPARRCGPPTTTMRRRERPRVAGLAPPAPSDRRPAAPRPTRLRRLAASYGGSVALLIRSVAGATVNYTVLQVEEGLEQPQADAFIRTHMPERPDDRPLRLARERVGCALSSFARRRPEGRAGAGDGHGPSLTGDASIRAHGAATALWARGGAVRLTGAREALSVAHCELWQAVAHATIHGEVGSVDAGAGLQRRRVGARRPDEVSAPQQQLPEHRQLRALARRLPPGGARQAASRARPSLPRSTA